MNNRPLIEPYHEPEGGVVTSDLHQVRLRSITPIRVSWRSRLRRLTYQLMPSLFILFLWRIPFFFDLKPFIWGYILAWTIVKPSISRWAAALLIPLWLLSYEPFSLLSWVRIAGIGSTIAFAWLFGKFKFRGMMISALVGMVSIVGFGLMFRSDLIGLVITAGEPLIGALLALAFVPALSQWPIFTEKKNSSQGLEGRVSLLFLIGLAFLGLSGIQWRGFCFDGVFATFLLVLAADNYGITASTVAGLTFSFIQLSILKNPSGAVFYGAFGLFAGLGREFSRWGIPIAAVLSSAFFIVGNGRPWLMDLQLLVPPLLTMGIYFMVPNKFLSLLPARKNSMEASDISQEERLRSVLTDRLKGLADVFDQLSQSFVPPDTTEDTKPVNIYTLIEEVSQLNCKQCTGYRLCWEENFYTTYREIFDLIALAEMYGQVSASQVTGRLASNCFQQHRLISAINHRIEQQKTALYWHKRLKENRHFLSGQLQGVASIMSNLAQEIRFNVDFRTELEDELKQCFTRWGLIVREIVAVNLGKDRLEINVEKHSCGGCHECRFIVAPLVTRLLGQKFLVWQRECHYEGDSVCRFSLLPARKFQVKTAVCKVPRQGNTTSGDSHAQMELREGYYVSMLSDGMGVGPRAALESTTTVSILEQLLRAGLNREFAVQMVNSVLLLRNQDETFATLDVALLDLYTAQAEFVKIGAAPTYIKRGKDVTVIRSTSLPVGILSSVDAETSTVQLNPGDLVVMITDGILDGRIPDEMREDWVWRTLTKMDVTGPEALGEFLLKVAAGEGEGACDDMTVVVLQLTEEAHEESLKVNSCE